MSKAAAVAPKVPNKVTNRAARPAPSLFSNEDFVILCPSAADSVLAQAALYYLPANYKLRVLVETFSDIMPLSDDQTIMGRISFGSKSELVSDSVSDSHHAIMYDEKTEMPQSSSPKVLISTRQTDSLLEDRQRNSFTVAFDSPEAVASAMLRIARATA